MFHPVCPSTSVPPDVKPEEPMDTSHTELVNIKREEPQTSSQEAEDVLGSEFRSNTKLDLEPELPMETSQPEVESICADTALSIEREEDEEVIVPDKIPMVPERFRRAETPSIHDYFAADAKLRSSVVRLTDVITHVMDDKSMIKELEENFLMDTKVEIKKEPEDPDFSDTNITYDLVGRVKLETRNVKTEPRIKQELDADELTEVNPPDEPTEENSVTQDKTIAVNFTQELEDTYNMIGATPLLITCKTEIKQETSRTTKSVKGCEVTRTTKSVKGCEVKAENKKQKKGIGQEKSNVSERAQSCIETNETKTKSLSIKSEKPDVTTMTDENGLPEEFFSSTNSKSQALSDSNNSDTEFLPSSPNKTEDESDWEEENYSSKKKSRRSTKERQSTRKLKIITASQVLPPEATPTKEVNDVKVSKVAKRTSTRKRKNKKQNLNKRSRTVTDRFSSNENSDDEFDRMFEETYVEKEKTIYKPRKKPWMCDICGKCFKGRLVLEEHKNSHDNVRPYKCTECEKFFMSMNHMRIHRTNIHAKKKRSYVCLYCGEKSPSEEYMKVHEASHSLPEGAETPRPFKCSHCDLTYATNYQLKRHLYRTKKKTVCPVCRQVFTTRLPLRHHMEQVHGIKKEYKCPTCDKVFPERKYLAFHKKSHSTVMKFFCDTCEKGFKMKHQLQQHLISHSDERPISCPQCDETFKRKTHLKQHVAAFHKN